MNSDPGFAQEMPPGSGLWEVGEAQGQLLTLAFLQVATDKDNGILLQGGQRLPWRWSCTRAT